MADTTNSQAAILPPPPRPSSQYNQEYANQLVRWLEQLARTMTGLSYLRGTGLYLPQLPTSGVGLKPGEVYQEARYLRVVLEGDASVTGASAAGAVGSVTVTV